MTSSYREVPQTLHVADATTCPRCNEPVGHHAGSSTARRRAVATCPLSRDQAYAILASAQSAADLGTAL